MNPRGKLFVVSAPSGSGKTTLCRELVSSVDKLECSISYTTRTPRIDEIEAKDYFFVSRPRFEEMIKSGSFLEWAQVYDNYYGTSKNLANRARDSGHDVILAIDTQGALQIQSLYSDAILIFILPPSLAELKRRLEDRALDDPGIILRRFGEVSKELNAALKYDYVILNDSVDEALHKLKAIIISERCRFDRNKHLIEMLLQETTHSL
jgi:guanylate kinase